MLKQQKLADSSAMADGSSTFDEAWKVATLFFFVGIFRMIFVGQIPIFNS